MKKLNSLTQRFGLIGAIVAFLATSFGITSCRPDFDLDKRMPEWLGTSIYETLQEGFKNDSTGEFYTFNTFVRLIDDLGQKDFLAKTGSRTLFVASDKAFEEFFKNCPFKGVTRYEDMSDAQKKMILNGCMLPNVYQVTMLSSSPSGNTQDPPLVGNSMRRVSASQTLDTIPIVKPADMPDSDFWKYWRSRSEDGIALLQDGTNRPLVYFVSKFMKQHGFEPYDYDFLFRLGDYSPAGEHRDPHDPDGASVNGVTIEWPNKKCFNGFLHVMSKVVYLMPNMAEELASNSNTRIYSSIIERFSIPYYISGEKANRDQNLRKRLDDPTDDLKNPALDAAMKASGDSIYVKKYLSMRSLLPSGNSSSSTGNAAELRTNIRGIELLSANNVLQFDPGWNSLIAPSSNGADIALQEDLAVMFVPYDSILQKWWVDKKEVGNKLRLRYGKLTQGVQDPGFMDVDQVIEDMKGIPLSVIVELVNNNMQNSLLGTIPSKFATVLNDAQDQFFEKMTRQQAEATIADVAMCCNGAIYFTTKVYSPTAYRSVSYPALVDERLKIINWAVRDVKLAYRAYLNSMVAEYSFFVPVVDSVGTFKDKLVWIDPASFYLKKYGSTDPISSLKAIAFSYGIDGGKETVIAELYNYNDDGTINTSNSVRFSAAGSDDSKQSKFIRNRLLDLMDYHIVIGEVESDTVPTIKIGDKFYSYFRTKGGGYVRFKNSASFGDINDMEVAGAWQIENEGEPDLVQRPVKIIERHDMNKNTSTTLGNGRTYLLDRPLLPARKSVYDVVSDTLTYPEFTSFFKLMVESGIFAKKSNRNEIASIWAVSTFSAFNYTVYVPMNAGIDALFESGKLVHFKELTNMDTQFKNYRTSLTRSIPRSTPNRDSVIVAMLADSLTNIAKKYFDITDRAELETLIKGGAAVPTKLMTEKKKEQILNFVKYHIQDNLLLVGASFNAGVDPYSGKPVDKTEYETAYMKGNQFVKVKVKGGQHIEITDKGNLDGTPRLVQEISTPGGKPYYNIMCREYELKSYAGTDATLDDDTYSQVNFYIEATSNAVVHLIDKPLCSGDIKF